MQEIGKNSAYQQCSFAMQLYNRIIFKDEVSVLQMPIFNLFRWIICWNRLQSLSFRFVYCTQHYEFIPYASQVSKKMYFVLYCGLGMLLVHGASRHQRFQKQISALLLNNTEGTEISETMTLLHLSKKQFDTISF